MFDYDDFTLGNSNINGSHNTLNYNAPGTGTLTVPTRYRLKFKDWSIIPIGTVAGNLTLYKAGSGGTIPIYGPISIQSGPIFADQTPDLIVESGYYMFGSVSAGSVSVLGTGEYVQG